MRAKSHLTLCDSVKITAPHQAPLSMGLSRQEYWSGLPCPPRGDLPHPGIKPAFSASPVLQVNSVLLSHWGSLLTLLPLAYKHLRRDH